MQSAEFQLEPLSCPSCIIKMERTLEKKSGVEEASVLFNSGVVKVKYDETEVSEKALQEIIEKLGYPVVA
ncbi:heavy metal-associated domain-containing protein [Virgibacillus sp. YIM 98842]|uniref:heavy-metal-associated domain-containing protein n=1 Tax=Virgibacillus sp. YIM 98842 TaxID=2663533 RepID=UPI0013DAF527|nr:heavy metal-associated domain-containing protein [Virgibacillus sp. YIM 98842]